MFVNKKLAIFIHYSWCSFCFSIGNVDLLDVFFVGFWCSKNGSSVGSSRSKATNQLKGLGSVLVMMIEVDVRNVGNLKWKWWFVVLIHFVHLQWTFCLKTIFFSKKVMSDAVLSWFWSSTWVSFRKWSSNLDTPRAAKCMGVGVPLSNPRV